MYFSNIIFEIIKSNQIILKTFVTIRTQITSKKTKFLQ
jgi:hypothetical protein